MKHTISVKSGRLSFIMHKTSHLELYFLFLLPPFSCRHSYVCVLPLWSHLFTYSLQQNLEEEALILWCTVRLIDDQFTVKHINVTHTIHCREASFIYSPWHWNYCHNCYGCLKVCKNERPSWDCKFSVNPHALWLQTVSFPHSTFPNTVLA